MWKKIIQIVYGKDCVLRERMLRTIILVGGLSSMAGIIEIFFIMEISNIMIPLLAMLLVTMGVSMYITFKYRKHDIAAILVGVVIIIIVFPLLFCLSGGIESGATVWMALGIVYAFVMFVGKKQKIFLVLCTLVYGGTYVLTYLYRDLLVPMDSRQAVYIDSFFSVMAVGLCMGIIMKIQMMVFEEEHQLNLKQREELERNSASKNIFFANVSHEIRTPINAIMGLNEMILRNADTDEMREYAKDIQLAGSMLLNQVNDILDLSQMEMKKMQVVPVNYSTRDLFGELVELIHVQMEKKGLEFTVDIDPDIPSELIGDEKRLKQVVLNILDNAVKYTKEGSVVLSAQREDADKGEVTLKIKVADTGIGIRKEDIEFIYDSFNRVDEKKNRRIAGSGLGLAITKQLVDLMGGEINVDSIYTKGTVFTVSLKQKIANETPVGEVKVLSNKGGLTETYRHSFEAPEARILVVDDNPLNSKVVKMLLEETKVEVDVANSGVECLEMTKRKYYHIILLDYMMPEMDGEETLKLIKSQENGLCREAAVIALTANTVLGARQIYLEQGFDGYVEKPVQSKSLEMEILKFIPSDIIEYIEDSSIVPGRIGTMQRTAVNRRKKVYITTDCCSDLPREYMDKYDIKLMYLYIRTPNGRFMDTKEIDSDSLTQYISSTSSSAYADSVTVEEYEEFFAEALTQAESVLHISLASRSGKSYGVAVEAAKGFDHVHVIDSCQASCGQGLVTLYAAKLAMEGRSVNEICDEVEKMISHVQTMVVMPGADIFFQNKRMRPFFVQMCEVMGLHPVAFMKNRKPTASFLLGGTLESAWRHSIRWHLRNRRKISKDIVLITHVGCSVKQQQYIVKEIKKQVDFEKIVIQKASFSTACNVGMEAIGISYYRL